MTDTRTIRTAEPNCTFSLPDELADLSLATTARADLSQTMFRQNVMFTDRSQDPAFTYSYQSSLNQITGCEINENVSTNEAGELVYELDIQGAMPIPPEYCQTGTFNFRQNNLYIVSKVDKTVIREYYFIGADEVVSAQIVDRDESLQIENNPIEAGIIVWDVVKPRLERS